MTSEFPARDIIERRLGKPRAARPSGDLVDLAVDSGVRLVSPRGVRRVGSKVPTRPTPRTTSFWLCGCGAYSPLAKGRVSSSEASDSA